MKDKIKLYLKEQNSIEFTGDFQELKNKLMDTEIKGWLIISDNLIISKEKIIFIEKKVSDEK